MGDGPCEKEKGVFGSFFCEHLAFVFVLVLQYLKI
jgi:hypothetical protein